MLIFGVPALMSAAPPAVAFRHTAPQVRPLIDVPFPQKQPAKPVSVDPADLVLEAYRAFEAGRHSASAGLEPFLLAPGIYGSAPFSGVVAAPAVTDSSLVVPPRDTLTAATTRIIRPPAITLMPRRR